MGSDAELVASVRRGDHRAFDELVRRHHGMVRRIARRFAAIPEDADDLVQEAFVTAYERLHQLEHADRFAGWLAAIARSEGLMWRRRRLVQPVLIPLGDDEAASPAAAAANWEPLRRSTIRDAVASALSSLTAEQRQVVRLHYLEGCDYRETAVLLDIPVSAVRGRLDRARKILRKELHKMTAISASGGKLNGRDLDALRAAASMASTDPERAAINTLYLAGEGRMVSTDGHRLFCYASSSLEGIPSALIHADLGRTLRDGYPQVRRARLLLSDVDATLRLENSQEIRAPLVDAAYPSWEKAVPSEWRLRATARAGDWLSALEMLARHREAGVMPPADPRAPNRILMVLSPDEGRIILKEGESLAREDGIAWEASVSFPAEFASGGAELIVAANAAYVEEAVRALGLRPNESVELSANEEEKSFMIQPAGNGGTFVVTMPLQRHVSARKTTGDRRPDRAHV